MSEHYRHTQPGWVILMAMAPALATVALTWGAPLILSETALAVLLAVALVFCALTVTGDERGLTLRFGPGLVLKRFEWSQIASCRAVRNKAWTGWGIRYLGDGWLYNVSGLHAIELTTKEGRHYRVGTDDPDGLESYIKSRLG